MATLILFALSRLLLRGVVGIRFDTSSLVWAWQLLDPLWLKEESVLNILKNLHMQPPLFNLLTALTLKAGIPPEGVLDPLFLLMGAGISAFLYLLGLEMGIRPKPSFALVGVSFVLNPSSILYETWYFYTYMTAFLTSALALFLVRFVRTRRTSYLVVALLSLSLLTLTRASYHLVIFPLLAAALWYSVRLKRAVVLVLLMSTPTLLWYLKNLLLFGLFSPSSWIGMNLQKMVWGMPGWDGKRFQTLHDKGMLSAAMTLPPFSPPEVYAERVEWEKNYGVPSLDSLREPTTGGVNYNHAVYPKVSRLLLRDNLNLFLRHPYVYFRATLSSFKTFTLPPYAYLDGFRGLFDGVNVEKFESLKVWTGFYNLLYGWFGGRSPGITTLLLIAAFLLLLPSLLRRPDTALLSLLMLYLIGVHTAFERRENMRFKFQFEGVMVVLVVGAAVRSE